MIRKLFLSLLGLFFVLLDTSSAYAQVETVSYQLISTTRVTRTDYDYVFKVVAKNNSVNFDKNVLGGVVSNSPYTSIIDGSVSFGDLLAGATATSSDTFTVRHNRTVAFSTNNFSINYSYNAFPPLTSGLKTMMSGGKLRQYYLKVPSNYSASGVAKPLIVTYHGTGGSYLNWLGGNNYYRDFAGYVGDNAIMVFPQALPNGNGVNQWDYQYDLQYFRDLAAELKTFVNYNTNKLFVVGHSSGAGIAHEIGLSVRRYSQGNCTRRRRFGG